jgi:hypothetical protein
VASQRFAVVIANPVAVVVYDTAQAVRPAQVMVLNYRDQGFDVVRLEPVIVIEVKDDVFFDYVRSQSINRSHAITVPTVIVR